MDYAENTSVEVDHGAGLTKRIVNGASDELEGRITMPDSGNGGRNLSIEQMFEDKEVPPWREQITLRGLLVSLGMGIMFNIIVMNLNLTTGVIPSLNVSAGLLGFFCIRTWAKILERTGFLRTPFTRQENTVIQTCVVACYGIAYSGGFGSYLLAMATKTYERAGTQTKGNSPDTVKDPRLGWMIGFLLIVSFLGLLAVVPLRKIMVIDYKLTYPSGTATAVLINGFHTPEGDRLARKQIRYLGKYFTGSFLWGFFKWFFSGDGETCGFEAFPTFGLKAFKERFYFDFSMTYVGAGMICPHLVNVSLLIGAIISWGIMWPLIEKQEGDWYPANLPSNSMQGIQGYRIFVAISLILGDGLYNFVKILYVTLTTMYRQWRIKSTEIPITKEDHPAPSDEQRRNEVFMKDRIPLWVAASFYVGLAAISTGVVPQIFPQLKWYHVLLAYFIAPVLGFCNAYGMGLTDWSLGSTYGKLALFIFAAWTGKDHGGVLAGLAACGVMMSIVSTSADLMQDFKTGYLTLSSPRSMFVSQVIGTAMGCVTAPLTFWLFYKAFDLGDPEGEYKAPNALLFRNMAILGVEGFSALPRHCLQICYGFFAFAVVTNGIRDRLPKRISQYVPIPMAMAIPFYLGAYFTIDMCLGSAMVFAWQKMNRKEADLLVPAVASGLMCGEGIWVLPSSILALAKVKPPICMKFLSRAANQRVDKFLAS